MISDPASDNKPTPDARREPAKESDQAEPPVLAASASPKPQPPHAHCQITYKKENNWWEKTKPFLEIAAAILVAVYTGFASAIYFANKAADAATSAAQTADATLKISQQEFRQSSYPSV